MQHYRKGDIVTVKAVVTTDFNPDRTDDDYFHGKVAVLPNDHHTNVWVGVDQLQLLVPFFGKNDFVATVEGDVQGQVIATFDDQVWVRFDDGELMTWPAVALKHRGPIGANATS